MREPLYRRPLVVLAFSLAAELAFAVGLIAYTRGSSAAPKESRR